MAVPCLAGVTPYPGPSGSPPVPLRHAESDAPTNSPMSPPSPTGSPEGRFNLDFDRDPSILSIVADETDIGVFTVGSDLRFVAWSQGAERITGFSASSVRGELCHMLDGPGCRGFDGLAALIQGEDPENLALSEQECRVRSSDGQLLTLLGSARVLVDPAGEVYGAVGVLADISAVLDRASPPDDEPEITQSLGDLVGSSEPMIEAFRQIRMAADSDVTTLITGESGTGKELCARAIHGESRRGDGPFVAVNCSAIPESLLESELFGHVRGAFTGASRDHRGHFEAAHGGTLFLDEIGDIHPHVQVKLLRVLQERQVVRVGGEGTIPVDVRLITATHKDLRDAIVEGALREDFYYRIRVFEIRMPALRERPADVPELALHFAKTLGPLYRRSLEGLSKDALECLVRYPWPGNVRELRNAIEHALVVGSGPVLGLFDLPDDVRLGTSVRSGSTGVQRAGPLRPDQEAEKLRILDALDEHGWNRTRTAAAIGISRVTLWKKIRRYHIDEGIFRKGNRSS